MDEVKAQMVTLIAFGESEMNNTEIRLVIGSKSQLTGKEPLSKFCVYTIVLLNNLRLASKAIKGRIGERVEIVQNKPMTEARNLVTAAKKNGERVGLFIAPAEGTARIAYCASIEDVEIEGNRTRLLISHLIELPIPGPSKTSLRKKKDGEPLHRDFIRPYAVCYTPKFAR